MKDTVDHLNSGSFITAKIIRFESFVMAPVVTAVNVFAQVLSIGVRAKFRVFYLTRPNTHKGLTELHFFQITQQLDKMLNAVTLFV